MYSTHFHVMMSWLYLCCCDNLLGTPSGSQLGSDVTQICTRGWNNNAYRHWMAWETLTPKRESKEKQRKLDLFTSAQLWQWETCFNCGQDFSYRPGFLNTAGGSSWSLCTRSVRLSEFSFIYSYFVVSSVKERYIKNVCKHNLFENKWMRGRWVEMQTGANHPKQEKSMRAGWSGWRQVSDFMCDRKSEREG